MSEQSEEQRLTVERLTDELARNATNTETLAVKFDQNKETLKRVEATQKSTKRLTVAGLVVAVVASLNLVVVSVLLFQSRHQTHQTTQSVASTAALFRTFEDCLVPDGHCRQLSNQQTVTILTLVRDGVREDIANDAFARAQAQGAAPALLAKDKDIEAAAAAQLAKDEKALQDLQHQQ